MSKKTAYTSILKLDSEKKNKNEKDSENIVTHFIWNKSNLSVFEYKNKILTNIGNFDYSSKSRFPLVEYLISNPERFIFKFKLNKIFQNSYSIYNIYDPHYFPINSVIGEIEEETCINIMKKYNSQQIIILDIDSLKNFSIYKYNYTEGLISFSKDDHKQKKDDNRINKVPESEQTILSEIGKILGEGSFDSPYLYKTTWLFSGDIVNSFNFDIFKLVKIFFKESRINIPIYNQVVVDKFQILNYLKLFNKNILKTSLENLFYKLPLTIINHENIGNFKYIDLISSKNESRQIVFLENRDNIYEIKDTSIIEYIPGEIIEKGYLWIYSQKNKALEDFSDLSYLDMKFPVVKNIQKKLIPFISKRYSSWIIKVNKTIYDRQIVGKNIRLKKSDLIQKIRPEKYIFFNKNIKKSDLLVTNTQRVLKGELLNKQRKINIIFETKQYTSPINGNFYTKNMDIGFLTIKQEREVKVDLKWLFSDPPTVIRKLSYNKLEILLKSVSMPLFKTMGQSCDGQLIVIDHLNEIKMYFKTISDAIIVCDDVLNETEIEELFQMGANAVIVPKVIEKKGINKSFWKLFGLGLYSGVIDNFPPFIKTKLKEYIGERVFFDHRTNELKMLDRQDPQSFAISKNMKTKNSKLSTNFSNNFEKGDIVLINSKKRLFTEAVIIHKENNRFLLRDRLTDKVFEGNRDDLIKLM